MFIYNLFIFGGTIPKCIVIGSGDYPVFAQDISELRKNNHTPLICALHAAAVLKAHEKL